MKGPKVSPSPLSPAIGGCVAISKTVIPDEPKDLGRDPWFDRLTTRSKVEGESRKLFGNQTILDPGSHPASVFAEASTDRLRDLAGMTNYNTAS
jgi:hypothetical protein